MNEELAGYAHPGYAQSLSEFGRPCHLSSCGGWILERDIAGTPHRDGMGCYPIFSCGNWAGLERDLELASRHWISVSLVTDPFGDFSPECLRRTFPDVCIPFKEHFTIDLQKSSGGYIGAHHRRNIKKAYKNVSVSRCDEPLKYLSDWVRLYDALRSRHRIKGISTFSAKSFGLQFEVPGLTVFRATRNGQTVAMILWYARNGVGYYHLGAADDLGYRYSAPYALFSSSIDYFRSKSLKWLDLGGVAGVSDAESGLRRFKEGWSTGTRIAYFCGRIFNRERYEKLSALKEGPKDGYFPRYRAGEFE